MHPEAIERAGPSGPVRHLEPATGFGGAPTRPEERGPGSVALVLGGGGVIGLAYHAAVLAALETDLRWDPRTADLVIGTSAGSLIGALLRRGIPALDLASLAVGAQAEVLSDELVQALTERPEMPPYRLFDGRLPRLPDLGLVAAWLRRPWRFDPVMAAVAVLPDGNLDFAEQTAAARQAIGDEWPDGDLWVCTVEHRTLARRVFGRPPLTGAPLGAAVSASCAVPGYFAPVEIGGSTYVDGGVRSATNADLLCRTDTRLAIIVSPMTGTGLARAGREAALRRYVRRGLARERAQLERAGIEPVVIEPGPDVIRVLGLDFMNDERLDLITHEAFRDTARQIDERDLRTTFARALRPAGSRAVA